MRDSPPLVVLLHGFTGGPPAFERVRQQLHRRANLSGLRFLAPWLHGHGAEPDLSAQSFDDEVERIAQLIEAETDTKRRHLCGYSLGGRVALGILTSRPALADSATLIGTHWGLESESQRRERLGSDAQWIHLLRERGLEAFVSEWQAQPLFASQQSVSAADFELQRALRGAHRAAALARSLEILGLGSMPSQRAALGQVTSAVTVLAGEKDHKFAKIGREMAAALPAGEFLLAGGCGHNLVLEAPQLVVRAIETALGAAHKSGRKR